MGETKVKPKRKASRLNEDNDEIFNSDDEFGNGLLEGVLEDGLEADDSSANDEDDESDAMDDSDQIASDDEEALDSDEMPDEENGEEGEAKEADANSTEVVERNGRTDYEDHEPVGTVTDAKGGMRYVYNDIDPVYDSDDSDAKEPANTIGNIDLKFYDSYPHIGYDINGKRIMRPATGDALDALLDTIEVPKGWTGLTDPATGKPLNISQDELELLRRVQQNEISQEDHDPYPDTVEWFTSVEEQMPLSAAPEPKRRFVPSKHEAKRVMKLVKAIREGRILPYKPPEEREREEEEEEEPHYDMWADEQPQPPNVMHIPAPKLPPPGYDLSYNPPPEYLPTDQEKKAWDDTDPEERDKEYLPRKFNSLRQVPAYDHSVKERFERSLDLYLAPRVRKNRLDIDPSSLLPKLPRPEELKPFPTMPSVVFEGHQGRVRSVSIDPTGLILASGGSDGAVIFWELKTGKQLSRIKLSSDESVDFVRWRPGKSAAILAAAVDDDVFFIVPPVIQCPILQQASRQVLDAGFGYAATANAKQPTLTANGVKKEPLGKWSRPGSRLEDGGVLLKVTVRSPVKVIHWHRRGEYICTVSPRGQRKSVLVHTVSKHQTLNPFRKIPGLAQTAQFHPTKPLLFVALRSSIRCYNLEKSELVKELQPGARWISSFDIHPGGGHLVVGSYDRRVVWHDLEMSTKPFKTMRFHSEATRAVKFHKSFPLFADASDDGSIQIFYGKAYNDLMQEPTIAPVKKLQGHRTIQRLGILDLDWHPTNPWLVSAGADGTCRLWT